MFDLVSGFLKHFTWNTTYPNTRIEKKRFNNWSLWKLNGFWACKL